MTRRLATPEDCDMMLREIRDFSRDDLLIAAGGARDGLKDAISGSDKVYAVFAEGQYLVSVYGIRLVSIVSNHAYVWILTTDLVDKYWTSWMRGMPFYIAEIFEEYDKLTAICPIKNKVSRKWLKYLGFEEGPMSRMHGIKFRTFSMSKDMIPQEKWEWLKGDDGWKPHFDMNGG